MRMKRPFVCVRLLGMLGVPDALTTTSCSVSHALPCRSQGKRTAEELRRLDRASLLCQVGRLGCQLGNG